MRGEVKWGTGRIFVFWISAKWVQILAFQGAHAQAERKMERTRGLVGDIDQQCIHIIQGRKKAHHPHFLHPRH